MKFTQVDEALHDERTQLAKDAMEKLGYRKLAQAIFCPDALMFALRKLEIQPLDSAAVEKYKRKKARNGMWSDTKFGLMLLTIATVIGFGIIPFLNKIMKVNWDGPHLSSMGVAVVFCVAVALTVTGLAHVLDTGHSNAHRLTRKWVMVSVANFQGNVPEFALSKALQINREIPRASLNVEYLTETTELGTRREPDPFLVAVLDDECYYLDVWDEKEYSS